MGESGEEKAFSEMAGKNESGIPNFEGGRFVAVPAKVVYSNLGNSPIR